MSFQLLKQEVSKKLVALAVRIESMVRNKKFGNVIEKHKKKPFIFQIGPHTFESGKFYFHTKCHFVFLAINMGCLVSLESGEQVRFPYDEGAHPKFFNNNFREALTDEILRALSNNPNFYNIQVARTPATNPPKNVLHNKQ